jgi:RNA polymerase sigma factor (sigma-70 family)
MRPLNFRTSETALLQALGAGSSLDRERAIKTLFFDDRTFFAQFRHFVLQHGGTTEEAEELFHDALIDFDRSAAKRNFPDLAQVHAYLFGMAKNKWYAHYRKRQATISLPDVMPEPDEPQHDDDNWQRKRQEVLDFGLGQLDERQRSILEAKYNKGMSMKDIAEHFGLSSEHLAKKYVDRFRRYLLERMKQHPEYPSIAEPNQ